MPSLPAVFDINVHPVLLIEDNLTADNEANAPTQVGTLVICTEADFVLNNDVDHCTFALGSNLQNFFYIDTMYDGIKSSYHWSGYQVFPGGTAITFTCYIGQVAGRISGVIIPNPYEERGE